MHRRLMIRDESPADAADISRVTSAAFTDVEVSNQTEQFVVQALRAAQQLTVSLVAEAERVPAGTAAEIRTLADATDG